MPILFLLGKHSFKNDLMHSRPKLIMCWELFPPSRYRYFSTPSSVTIQATLRPYQEECIQRCLEEYKKGVRRQAVSLPVGSGKTVIFANLINRLPEPRPGANKVLVLAHREELLTQAQRQIRRFAPNLRISIEMGKSKCDHSTDHVVVASVPTLGRSNTGSSRLSRFRPEEFKCIIVDEAHHSVADSYLRIMKHFGVDEKSDEILVWGCSATLSRYDELALGRLFDKIVYHKDMGEMIKEGWLCKADYRQIYTNIDLKSVPIKKGDFQTRELSLAIDTPTRNELVAATWYQRACLEAQKKATIVFALNVQHALNLQAVFSASGIETALITSETPDDIRRDVLDRFSKGGIPVLINCSVLTEGTDLPITDCILLTRPTCNSNLFIQMVGRGLRRHQGKESCLVLDFIDEHRSRNRNLLAHPTLEAAVERGGGASEGEREGGQERKRPKPLKDILVDDIEVKMKTISLEDLVNPKGSYSWFKVDQGLFALANKDITFLLEINSDFPILARIRGLEWGVDGKKFKVFPINDKLSGGWRPSFEMLADFAQLVKENEMDGLRLDTFWKRRRPISVNQRQFLFSILKSIPGIDSFHQSRIYSLAMGTASEMITKYIIRYKYLKRPFTDFNDWISGINDY